jgi:hypothetical protein
MPFDLDFLLDNFPLYLSDGRFLTIKSSLVDPSMFFLLISSDSRDETTSSSTNVVELFPISTNKLSQESNKEML